MTCIFEARASRMMPCAAFKAVSARAVSFTISARNFCFHGSTGSSNLCWLMKPRHASQEDVSSVFNSSKCANFGPTSSMLRFPSFKKGSLASLSKSAFASATSTKSPNSDCCLSKSFSAASACFFNSTFSSVFFLMASLMASMRVCVCFNAPSASSLTTENWLPRLAALFLSSASSSVLTAWKLSGVTLLNFWMKRRMWITAVFSAFLASTAALFFCLASLSANSCCLCCSAAWCFNISRSLQGGTSSQRDSLAPLPELSCVRRPACCVEPAPALSPTPPPPPNWRRPESS
mmetsp:Transcript_23441/g.58276  ORF Transcript_23441/g.58276 Transcript_23441/m.58276 type:complete len:291 (-) Transcript_23441:216-1088(-)